MIRLIIIFVLFTGPAFGDSLYVDKVSVDSTFSNECANCSTPSDNDYDPTTRDCGSGSDTVYNSIQGAVTAVSTGDVIEIRNGTWEEYDIDIPTGRSGTAWTDGNFITMRSYAGEWATLDGSASPQNAIIRRPTTNNKDQTDATKYWKFERLEFTGNKFGILLTHGPIWVRYCYFHECSADVTGDEPMAPLWVNEAQNCIVEYNYFYDSYDLSPGTNDSLIGFLADYHEEATDGAEGETFVTTQCIRGNVIRYNRLDGGGHTQSGIHHKGDQRFGQNSRNPATVRSSYSTYGDRIHHNIILNMGSIYKNAILSGQDNIWIHNNITDGMIIAAGWQHVPQVYNQVVHNNTLIGSHASINISGGTTQSYSNTQNNWYDAGFGGDPDNGYDRTVTMNCWVHNNLVADNIGGYSYDEPITLNHYMADDWGTLDGDSFTHDFSLSTVTNNLFHSCPDDVFRMGSCDNETSPATCGDGELDDSTQTNSEFNSHSATWRGVGSVVNYDVDTAGLFLGTSGANQYIADGDYVVDGGTGTVGDSGVGGSHPFRSGETIPSYIGATNPNDYAWVSGVMSMDATYFKNQTAGTDPTWVEGATSISAKSTASGGSRY